MAIGHMLFTGSSLTKETKASPLPRVNPGQRIIPESSTFYTRRDITVTMQSGNDNNDFDLAKAKSYSTYLQTQNNLVILTKFRAGLKRIIERMTAVSKAHSLTPDAIAKFTMGNLVPKTTIEALAEVVKDFCFNQEPFKDLHHASGGYNATADAFIHLKSQCMEMLLKNSNSFTVPRHVRLYRPDELVQLKKEFEMKIKTILNPIDTVKAIKSSTKIKDIEQKNGNCIVFTTVYDLVQMMYFFPFTREAFSEYISNIDDNAPKQFSDFMWLFQYVLIPCKLIGKTMEHFGLHIVCAHLNHDKKQEDWKNIFAKFYEDVKNNAKTKMGPKRIGTITTTRMIEMYLDVIGKYAKNELGTPEHTELRNLSEAVQAFLVTCMPNHAFVTKVNLHGASVLVKKKPSRKRKKAGEHETVPEANAESAAVTPDMIQAAIGTFFARFFFQMFKIIRRSNNIFVSQTKPWRIHPWTLNIVSELQFLLKIRQDPNMSAWNSKRFLPRSPCIFDLNWNSSMNRTKRWRHSLQCVLE